MEETTPTYKDCILTTKKKYYEQIRIIKRAFDGRTTRKK
jgi:hypothetical protein